MRGDWRIRTSPKHLEMHFPVFYQTVPCAEENLLFVQKQCYALYSRVTTTFSVVEKIAVVCFDAAESPQRLKLLERVAPLTERISISRTRVTLYVKYFAEPSAKWRALRALFCKDK